jgi:hypothetical protein
MLKVAMLSILALFLICTYADAQDVGLGLGVILGEPTGLSGKLWLRGNTAIAGAAAWSFIDEVAVQSHVDILLHSFRGGIRPHYGVGVRVRLEEDRKAGVRFPLGLTYIFEELPFDFFIEVAPIVDLAPETEFVVNGAIGFRYYIFQ